MHKKIGEPNYEKYQFGPIAQFQYNTLLLIINNQQ